MDNEDDDDGNFTKWMSSYWGHGVGEEHAKERKRSFRRPSRSKAERRASLPCMSQLEAMQLDRLHTKTMAPVPVHLKTKEEKEMHLHPRARRVASDESSRTKMTGPNITTIPELSESLEKKLRFHKQKMISVSDSDSLCYICHDDLRNGRHGIQELHCGHHFHKKCIENWLWQRQSCPTCQVHVTMPEPLYWSSARVQFP